MNIMKLLKNYISGLCVPCACQFVGDLDMYNNLGIIPIIIYSKVTISDQAEAKTD